MFCKQGEKPTDTMRQANVAEAILNSESSSGWYIAYTKPRQEYVAEVNLNQQDFQTYLPLFKVFRKTSGQSAGMDGTAEQSVADGAKADTAAVTAFEPMFPRYLFFKPTSQKQSIAAARSSRGVNSLVSFGAELAVVSPEVLQTIRKLEDQRNSADLPTISPFQPGHRVRLRNTALDGIEGVVQAVGAKRVVLLMEFLGQQKTVRVKHAQVELV